MTLRQLHILRFLEKAASELSRVFQAGARMRNDVEFPAHVYFIAYAAREHLNCLPGRYSGEREEDGRRPKDLCELAKWRLRDAEGELRPLAGGAPTAEPKPVAVPWGFGASASHGRYVAFQLVEVAIPRSLAADILRLIAELRSALPSVLT